MAGIKISHLAHIVQFVTGPDKILTGSSVRRRRKECWRLKRSVKVSMGSSNLQIHFNYLRLSNVINESAARRRIALNRIYFN